MGIALCVSRLLETSSLSAGSLTSIPGQPNHWNWVDLVNPAREVTKPPLERDDWKVPSTRFMDNGSRFETIIRFCWLSLTDPILGFWKSGMCDVNIFLKHRGWDWTKPRITLPRGYELLYEEQREAICCPKNGKWQMANLRQYEC